MNKIASHLSLSLELFFCFFIRPTHCSYRRLQGLKAPRLLGVSQSCLSWAARAVKLPLSVVKCIILHTVFLLHVFGTSRLAPSTVG